MPDVFESHLRAAASSDLTPLETRCDVDLLTAAGFVAQNHPLGVALYKAKFQGDTEHTHYILHQVYLIARRYMESHRIRGNSLDVAREVLVWFVNDTCPHCEGRKLTLIPDTSRLSAKPCGHCHGSGIKPLAAGEHYEARRHVAMQCEILIDAVHTALRRAGR